MRVYTSCEDVGAMPSSPRALAADRGKTTSSRKIGAVNPPGVCIRWLLSKQSVRGVLPRGSNRRCFLGCGRGSGIHTGDKGMSGRLSGSEGGESVLRRAQASLLRDNTEKFLDRELGQVRGSFSCVVEVDMEQR